MKRLQTGNQLDGFLIGEPVTSGGMAHIYRVSPLAGCPDPGFELAMKVPRMAHDDGAETLVSHELEAMVHASLSGAHVPRLVASGELERHPYLVMEWIEGQSLEQRLQAGRLAVDEVARLGIALAHAVQSLHAQHVIHLDIKPGNVMIRPDGTAVMIDFGFAHHDQRPDLLAEQFRRAVGSPSYIAPEQVIGVRNEPRSDLFSIGVTLYELCTGELPFGAPATRAGLRDRLWADPLPPRAREPAVPPWLQEIILRCLEVDPQQRHASAAQLAFELANPDQVALTERSQRLRRVSWSKRFKSWLRASGWDYRPPTGMAAQQAAAPIVLAAWLGEQDAAGAARLRLAVARHLAGDVRARLSCACVIPGTPLQTGGKDELSETSIHRRHMVALRQWVQPLALSAERVSTHVLVAGDPARALLEYARLNQVSLIVMHAPTSVGLLPRTPVAYRVAQEASCSVHLVKNTDTGHGP